MSEGKKQDLTPTELEMLAAFLPNLTSRKNYSILIFLISFIANCKWVHKIFLLSIIRHLIPNFEDRLEAKNYKNIQIELRKGDSRC